MLSDLNGEYICVYIYIIYSTKVAMRHSFKPMIGSPFWSVLIVLIIIYLFGLIVLVILYIYIYVWIYWMNQNLLYSLDLLFSSIQVYNEST